MEGGKAVQAASSNKRQGAPYTAWFQELKSAPKDLVGVSHVVDEDGQPDGDGLVAPCHLKGALNSDLPPGDGGEGGGPPLGVWRVGHGGEGQHVGGGMGVVRGQVMCSGPCIVTL